MSEPIIPRYVLAVQQDMRVASATLLPPLHRSTHHHARCATCAQLLETAGYVLLLQALGPGHDHRVTLVGTAAEPLADLLLRLDLDRLAVRRVGRRRQVGKQRSAGRQRDLRAPRLPRVQRFAEPPERRATHVVEP